MTIQDNSQLPELKVGRRGFIAGSAGLTFTFSVAGFMTGRSGDVYAASGRADVNGWVRIDADNTITIAAPAAEMGQGIMTALPMIVAEELDADWSKVKAVFPPPVPKVFGNPKFGGGNITVASRAVDGYWDKARMHGAEARQVLIDAVAAEWKVPASELTTAPSMVVHKASGRKISYGEIVAFAKMPAEMPKIDPKNLKDPSQFRIIGQPITRLDLPEKVNGSAPYGIDVQVPGMIYAAILRSPVDKGTPAKVDDADAKKVNGVISVIKLQNSVAVIAKDIESAFAGKSALRVEWQGGAPAGYDSEPAMEQYVARGRNTAEAGLPFETKGDVKAAMAGAAKTITADYQADYTYHAQMEPMNVTALVNEAGDGADVWTGTQAANLAQFVGSLVLKTKPPMIKIHQQYLGGGFGRRIYPDHLPEALVLSKITKKPVKVVWTREDDVSAGKLRPMTAHHMEAGIDANGKIVAWSHRVVGEAVVGYTGPPDRLKAAKGVDPLTMEGANYYYDIPNRSIEYLRENREAPLAAWRAIGSGYNKFAVEAFIDDIARDLGKDPVEYRLSMLQHDPRAVKVIETVAEMAEWSRKREGTALGFSFVDVWSTVSAGVVEVAVDKRTGRVKVLNFWSAVDPGIVVNPDTVVAQTESNIVYGLSQALKERITFEGGAIQQSNFHDYEVIRMSEVPEIHTRVISTNNHPTGIGEIALPMVGGAVSNAILAATGVRMRHMPFTPTRVKEAMKA